MAITLISKPATWGRATDTNRLTYQFSSDEYTQPNFQFQFVLSYWDINGVKHDIATFYKFPSSGGTVEYNPAIVYKSYLSYKYNASNTTLDECVDGKDGLDGARRFSLRCYEFYGIPPARQLDTLWDGEYLIGDALKVYNGAQQFIPYDYIALNPLGNGKWVMSGETSGQFLTDATEYHLTNDDIAFLYFNGDNITGRPTQIRYQIYYKQNESDEIDLGNKNSLNNDPFLDQTTAREYPYYNLDFDGNDPGTSWATVGKITQYDTNVSYTYVNSLQYYFPMGPRQIISTAVMPSGYTNKWIFYKVDILSGETVLNRSPFMVYNTCKWDRFGKWQLAWLNPHGGFDCYTFDRKTDISYKPEKDTYKQRLPLNPSYSTYDAGERVYQSKENKEIILRTGNLTQREAQLLIQLAHSSVVYVNTIYEYSGATYPYGVNWIITNDTIKYPQKKNDKEIFMEIKIRPANENPIQSD